MFEVEQDDVGPWRIDLDAVASQEVDRLATIDDALHGCRHRAGGQRVPDHHGVAVVVLDNQNVQRTVVPNRHLVVSVTSATAPAEVGSPYAGGRRPYSARDGRR